MESLQNQNYTHILDKLTAATQILAASSHYNIRHIESINKESRSKIESYQKKQDIETYPESLSNFHTLQCFKAITPFVEYILKNKYPSYRITLFRHIMKSLLRSDYSQYRILEKHLFKQSQIRIEDVINKLLLLDGESDRPALITKYTTWDKFQSIAEEIRIEISKILKTENSLANMFTSILLEFKGCRKCNVVEWKLKTEKIFRIEKYWNYKNLAEFKQFNLHTGLNELFKQTDITAKCSKCEEQKITYCQVPLLIAPIVIIYFEMIDIGKDNVNRMNSTCGKFDANISTITITNSSSYLCNSLIFNKERSRYSLVATKSERIDKDNKAYNTSALYVNDTQWHIYGKTNMNTTKNMSDVFDHNTNVLFYVNEEVMANWKDPRCFDKWKLSNLK